MKTKPQMWRSCTNLNVLKAPCHMHLLLLRRWCNFVFCPARFVIGSGGSHSLLGKILDIFYIYAEMGNHERTQMQLKFQESPILSVFVTTPRVGGTGLNLTPANHAVITQKFWVLNELRQAFARVVWLGQNRVPHTWLVNTGPDGYYN